MRLSHLQYLCYLAAMIFISPQLSAQGIVDSYPSKPVTLILAVAAGGPTDVEARLYTKKMGELMGQPFLLDYKPGAGATIGTAYVAKTTPDGYTLLMIAGSFTVMPAVYRNLSFDPLKDFAPVSLMSEKPMVLMVNSSFLPKTFSEYVAYAKANPRMINLGASGSGGVNHLMNIWLHTLTSAQVTHVTYKGEALLMPDLLAGRINAFSTVIGTAMRLAKTGKMRALGSTGVNRSRLWPDLPTIDEQGVPGFSYTSWVGIGAPGGTSVAIVNKLSENFSKAVKSPEVVGALEPEGYVLVGSSPAQFKQLIVTEIERWQKVVQENRISVD